MVGPPPVLTSKRENPDGEAIDWYRPLRQGMYPGFEMQAQAVMIEREDNGAPKGNVLGQKPMYRAARGWRPIIITLGGEHPECLQRVVDGVRNVTMAVLQGGGDVNVDDAFEHECQKLLADYRAGRLPSGARVYDPNEHE